MDGYTSVRTAWETRRGQERATREPGHDPLLHAVERLVGHGLLELAIHDPHIHTQLIRAVRARVGRKIADGSCLLYEVGPPRRVGSPAGATAAVDRAAASLADRCRRPQRRDHAPEQRPAPPPHRAMRPTWRARWSCQRARAASRARWAIRSGCPYATTPPACERWSRARAHVCPTAGCRRRGGSARRPGDPGWCRSACSRQAPRSPVA
jgi:hypothetical protein